MAKGYTISKRPQGAGKNIAGKRSAFRDRRFSIVSDESDEEDSSEEQDSPYEDLYEDQYQDNYGDDYENVIDSESSSSDDDDVDFVALTKQRRAEAMEAKMRTKEPQEEEAGSKENAGENVMEEGGDKDSKPSGNKAAVAATKRKKNRFLRRREEGKQSKVPNGRTKVKKVRKLKKRKAAPLVPIPGEEIELDDSLVDAVISEEEKRYPGLFENTSSALSTAVTSSDDVNSILGLTDKPIESSLLTQEDLGEVVEADLSNIGVADEPVTLAVPRFGEAELNSDADYEFDADALIRTLENDDDELELFGSDDDDFTGRLNANNSMNGYLTKEETDALVEDYGLKNESVVVGGTGESAVVVDDDDGEEEEDETGDDSESAGESDWEESSDDSLDIMGFREIFGPSKPANGSLYVPQSAIVSSDEDEDNEENEDSSAVQDDDESSDPSSDDELIHYFFSSSSEDGYDSQDDANATDEDTTVPRGSVSGLKRAKEILSSSRNNFRAPKLGTFVVSARRKPYGIIDGYSTRFLHPTGNKLSVLKGVHLSVSPVSKSRRASASVNSPVQLDELLNMSELEDASSDPGSDAKKDQEPHIADSSPWEFFNRRRVPLTAFRNRGLINSREADPEPTRRYKFHTGESLAKHQHHKNHSKTLKSSVRRKQTKQAKKVKFRKELNFGDEFLLSPSDPVKLRRGSKKRLRRKSIAEAQAEGLHPTKSGLFAEGVLNDVGQVLLDMGATDYYNTLFSEGS